MHPLDSALETLLAAVLRQQLGGQVVPMDADGNWSLESVKLGFCQKLVDQIIPF